MNNICAISGTSVILFIVTMNDTSKHIRRCSVNGCITKHSAKGYCSFHYTMYIAKKRICCVKECNNMTKTTKMCSMHYNRLKRNGSPYNLRGWKSLKGTENPTYKHGMTGKRIYRIWQNMLNRCRNPNSTRYDCWGGRGIKVCERWKVFGNFYEDMNAGYSDNMTIERVDVNGHYCPENCTWIPREMQPLNTRKTNESLLPLIS